MIEERKNNGGSDVPRVRILVAIGSNQTKRVVVVYIIQKGWYFGR
jgi:hypothetical protein